VPTEGESAVVDGHRLVAERVQGRRIGRVRILALPSGTAAGEESGEERRDEGREDDGERQPRSENGTR